MRFIRRILFWLALVSVFAAILVAVAFMPAVQTWVAQQALDRYPNFQATVGTVTAGLSRVQVSDLHLQRDGAVLTVPALELELPLKAALWDRNLAVRTLVARGWTLDLSRWPAPAEAGNGMAAVAPKAGGEPAPSTTAPAPAVLDFLRGLLAGWGLPCDLALDGVDLEGDVLLAASAGKERMQVSVKGGGLAAGRSADFALVVVGADKSSGRGPEWIGASGRLAVTMGSARTIQRIEFKGKWSPAGISPPEDLTLVAGLAAGDRDVAQRYTLELIRGGRYVAAVAASFVQATGRLAGKWQVDWRESDAVRFDWSRAWPLSAVAGEGDFDADPAGTRVRVAGRLRGESSRKGAGATPWERLGPAALAVEFEMTRSGPSVRFERVSLAATGARPIATARSLQPFTVDENTGALTLTEPDGDWMEGALQGVPVASFSGLVAGVALAGGDVTGDFAVKAVKGGFALRSKAPLVATGVSLQREGQVVGQDLELAWVLAAERTAQGWALQAAPLTVGSGGRQFVALDVKVSPIMSSGGRFAISGSWKADLEALAAQPAILGLRSVKGRTAAGEFSLSTGSTLDVKGKVTIVGRDPKRSLAASGRAFITANGGASFHLPLTLTLGPSVAELAADGTWSPGKAGPRFNLEVGSVKVAREHLELIAAGLAEVGGVEWAAALAGGKGGPVVVGGKRDQRPFWGDTAGRVKFDFYHLQAGAQELEEVGGTVEFEHGSLRLDRGRAVLVSASPPPVERGRRAPKLEPPRNPVTVEGDIAFDAAAEVPYRLKASATVATVDAASLFTAAQVEKGPVLEGRFSMVDTLTSSGANLAELLAGRQEELRFTSEGGIFRFLKTNVAESIPNAPTPVADTVASVGSALGSLLGFKGDPFSSGKITLSKEMEAVLNFSYQVPEIRYEHAAITARREPDETIRLTEVVIRAPAERLTGTGVLSPGGGRPLRERPISLELQLGLRGKIVDLLAPSGLLTTEPDADGYTRLNQSFHFGGTLEQIDNSAWHDALVKAATQKPERGKKRG